MTRYLFVFACVCALGFLPLVGCGDNNGGGGSGGTAGSGGSGGSTGGTGGSAGTGGTDLCDGVDCTDGNECTVDVCDTDAGTCSNPNAQNGVTCTAGSFPGECAAGICLGLCVDVDCTDGNECTEDVCDRVDGSCGNTNRPNGSDCDFGGLPGRCTGGVCMDAALCADVDCGDGNDCTDDACNPVNAICSHPNKPDGSLCQAGIYPGLCAAGSCQGLCEDVSCDDGNQCTLAQCDPYTGSCSNPSKPNGTSCDFGGLPGRCSSGLCTSLCSGVVCDDGNECTADYCDPSDASWCVHTTMPDGTSCDLDGDTGVCEAGECVCPTGAVNVWFKEEKTRYCDYDPDNTYYAPIPCLWAQVCVPGIGWSNAAELECEIPSCGRFSTRLYDILTAADSAGNAFVAWTEVEWWSDGQVNMSAIRFTPEAGWGEGANLGMPYWLERTTDFAMDGNGNAIAVIATNTAIVAKRYAAGEGWGAQEVLATYGHADGQQVGLAMEQGGTAFASWRAAQGFVASRYLPAEGWGEPELIGAAGPQLPEIEIYANGDATAVWADWDGVTWSNQYVVGIGWGAPELVD